jgi:hypothetical protein
MYASVCLKIYAAVCLKHVCCRLSETCNLDGCQCLVILQFKAVSADSTNMVVE